MYGIEYKWVVQKGKKSEEAFFQNAHVLFSKQISIKKPHVYAKNLKRIFEATLILSQKRGFHSMSMRDLCEEVDIGLGGIYAYFSSKEDLLNMMLVGSLYQFKNVWENLPQKNVNEFDQLMQVLALHLYMSEYYPHWFIFSFMEAKNFDHTNKKLAQSVEIYTESLIKDRLSLLPNLKINKRQQDLLCLSLKALLQDWYLKRWKYKSQKITPELYLKHIEKMIRGYISE